MIKFSAQVTRIRWTEQGEERVELPAQFLPVGRIFLPKDSDVDEGDMIEEILPDGHTRTFRLSDIQFMNAGWGAGGLDHTEAHLEPVATRPAVATTCSGTISGLHRAVSAAAGGLYEDGQYASATCKALQAVEERVARLSTVNQSGTELMAHAFGGTTPLLDVTTTTGPDADDERAGFALLFTGAIQALQNPRGHGPSIVDQPEEAFEYLALASLLMRRLDIAASDSARAEQHRSARSSS